MALTSLTLEQGHVGCILLEDSEGKNIFDDRLRSAIAGDLEAAFLRPEIRAIVIGADGPNFSVGGDLSRIAQHPTGQASHEVMRDAGDLALKIWRAPKPIVAAVNGHCVGAAAGLALLCDTVVMSQGAHISFPFMKLGLLPDFGTSFSVPQRVGVNLARQIFLSGKGFDGEEAARIGLVDEVVEDRDVWAAALRRAQGLARAPRAALLQLRLLMRNPPRMLSEAIEIEALNQAICFGSPDTLEAVAAFRERRTPDFVSRDEGVAQ